MSWNEIDQFLVKEHVGMFKAANNYDMYDLETGEEILQCREPVLGFATKMFRFTKYKRYTPFDVEVTDTSGDLVVRIKRGVSLFMSKVEVYDGDDNYLGGFKQKFFSLGGAFTILDETENPVCELKGKWTGWDFSFKAGESELARVTKKWTGLGKELFTSADNYVLDIDEAVPAQSKIRKLILAAVVCIDMVLKE